MNFNEKLRRRVEQLGLSKAKASKSAGLKPTTISSYIAKTTSIPRGDIALRIARAIHVPAEWLLDDAAGWPPPESDAKPSADQLDDEALMLKVAELYRRSFIRLLDALDRAEKVDWSTAASTLSDAELAILMFPIRYAAEMIARFNPAHAARARHATMPGFDRPKEAFNERAAMERVVALLKDPKFLALYVAAMKVMPEEAAREIEAKIFWGADLVTALDTARRFAPLLADPETPLKPSLKAPPAPAPPPAGPPRSASPPAAPATPPHSKAPQIAPHAPQRKTRKSV